MISIVVAASTNNVIGKDKKIPWLLKDDLVRFKILTMNHSVIMGRETFESILERNGNPLPGRKSIVLSRKNQYRYQDVSVLRDPVLSLWAKASEEFFVIGGSQVYKQALPHATRIYLTQVEAQIEGDTFFPIIDSGIWRVVRYESYPADERNQYPFSYFTFERSKR
jgi:dihydrofolate reductase